MAVGKGTVCCAGQVEEAQIRAEQERQKRQIGQCVLAPPLPVPCKNGSLGLHSNVAPLGVVHGD